MGLELRHLHTFQTIVDEGSFVRAAEKLNYSQATITLQIQQLEEKIGIALFLRENKRRLQLTEAGRLFLIHTTRIRNQVDSLEQAMHELRIGETGHLRIGGIEPMVSLLFPQILKTFSQTYPKVRITIETRGTTGIHTMVSNDEVDVGLTTPPPPRAGLQFEPLYTEILVALVPEAHPLNKGEIIPLHGLANTQVILTNPTCAYRELIERVLIEHGVRLESTLEIGSMSALKQMVQDGMGIALLPMTATRTVPEGTVVKQIDQLDLHIPIGLVRKPEAVSLLQTKTLAMFISLLKQELQALG